MSGNDWRMLASELGYTTGDIHYIESEKDNNTSVLFREYDTKTGATLNEVYRSLGKMQRQDCLDIIINALPEIQQAYNKANESQILHATKSSELQASKEQFQWPGSPSSCPYTHHPEASCGSHACYQCSHTAANCGAVCPSHHTKSYASPCLVHLPHPHHSLCQAFIHSDTVQKTCESSLPSLHHASSSTHDCLMKTHSECIHSAAQPLGGSSPIRHSPPGNQVPVPRGHPDLLPGYSSHRGSPTYSPYQNVNNIPLPNNISPVDNSNLSSSGSSSSDSFNSRQLFSRQYSNECNITQTTNGEKRLRNNKIRDNLGCGDFVNQHYAAPHGSIDYTANIGLRSINSLNPKSVHPSDASNYVDNGEQYFSQNCDVKVRNAPGGFTHSSYVSNQFASNKTNTSLAHSEMLAGVPYNVKPTNEHRTVGEKIEIGMRSQDGKSPQSSKETSVGIRHPKVAEVHAEQPVPSVIKPVNVKRAFCNIEVFVTYSYDNEDHAKQVLSLCMFLKSNGSTCSVDLCEKKSAGRSLEQLEFCRRKVLEADFILVCISQKYLEDISSDSATFFSQTNERWLHTREIYDLMKSEYLKKQQIYGVNSYNQTQRLIPLIFPKMTSSQVPPWMMNGHAYRWPRQYTELASRLTKLKERTIGKRTHEKQLGVRERNDSDLDMGTGMDMTNLMSSVLCSS